MQIRNKKVLVMGLGLLGGGIATTKWFVRHGAKVTVTDLRSKKILAPSIKSLGSIAKKIKFVLGRHRESDFKNNEIVVVNPAVPRESKYLKIARKNGAELENEASLFFRFSKNPIIAVTGTRGKTTTANWVWHLLKKKFPKAVLAGNSSNNPMLGVLDKLDCKSPVVVELSSWHLELLGKSKKGPQVAIITNIYRDHLNRYRSMRSYALAKASIFRDQTKKDFLILNKNNSWTKFFLKLRPKSKILYFPKSFWVNPKKIEKKYGYHNLENFSAAALAANKAGVSWGLIKKAADNLPEIKYREELVYKKNGVKIYNDTTATSPDGTIVALKRFSQPAGGREALILIAGGTDKNLNFSDWAKMVKKYIKPENLFLLDGSATKKMRQALKRLNYFKESPLQLFENLQEIIKRLKIYDSRTKNKNFLNRKSGFIILFSPGAASFEKFKNEFDRGEKFNLYSRQLFNF